MLVDSYCKLAISWGSSCHTILGTIWPRVNLNMFQAEYERGVSQVGGNGASPWQQMDRQMTRTQRDLNIHLVSPTLHSITEMRCWLLNTVRSMLTIIWLLKGISACKWAVTDDNPTRSVFETHFTREWRTLISLELGGMPSNIAKINNLGSVGRAETRRLTKADRLLFSPLVAFFKVGTWKSSACFILTSCRPHWWKGLVKRRSGSKPKINPAWYWFQSTDGFLRSAAFFPP